MHNKPGWKGADGIGQVLTRVDDVVTALGRRVGLDAAGVGRLLTRALLTVSLLLATLSTGYVGERLIVRFAPERITFVQEILSGQAEPPYRYRVLKPLIGESIGYLIAPVVHSPIARHVVAYSLV